MLGLVFSWGHSGGNPTQLGGCEPAVSPRTVFSRSPPWNPGRERPGGNGSPAGRGGESRFEVPAYPRQRGTALADR